MSLDNMGPFKKHPPDNLERGIRFGCGFVFGFILILYITIRSGKLVWLEFPLIGISCLAAIIGLLAMLFGDRFWHFFIRFR